MAGFISIFIINHKDSNINSQHAQFSGKFLFPLNKQIFNY
jgi:hypothetical protein